MRRLPVFARSLMLAGLAASLAPAPALADPEADKSAIAARLKAWADVIMVFDHRFSWSPAVPDIVSILGDVLAALGILIYFFVVRENRNAAATVQVVEGQTVVSTGLYAIVRHPL